MSTHSTNSKSILAKALATENISVIFDPSAKTASFDVANRVLTMPILKTNESESVLDMFIGHECAHALFSPYREKDRNSKGNWWVEAQEIGGTGNAAYVQDIMNVVEDVRIEKKMVEKFPGLRRDFSAGYRELESRDFFGTKNKNLSEFGFVDRINLHFKCGATMNVPFTPEEQELVDMVSKISTHDEMIDATRKIFKFIQGQVFDADETTEKVPVAIKTMNQTDGEGTAQDFVNGAQGEVGDQSGDNALSDGRKSGNVNPPDMLLPPISTQKMFDEKSRNGIVDSSITQTQETTLPVPDLKKIVFPVEKTHAILEKTYTKYGKLSASHATLISRFRQSFADLLKSSDPLVATLIKQFEMKKAADLQKRTSISRTGKIDCDRISKYKISDDIFSRFAKVTEGKNHGLVMYVDWSSSMQLITNETISQIIILVQFCRKMNIPFDVYLFSSRYELMRVNSIYKTKTRQDTIDCSRCYESVYRGANDHEDSPFCLIHILSSSMPKTKMNESLFYTYLLGRMVTGDGEEWSGLDAYAQRQVPEYFTQGNTPLDPAILAAMYMVPEFQEKHKVQIVNTIFLTDGESGHTFFTSCPEANSWSKNFRSFVNSPLTKKKFIADDRTTTDTMLRIFREVTGSTTIGFYINTRSSCEFVNQEDEKSDLRKMLKETGFIEAPKTKLSQYYDYSEKVYKYYSDKPQKNHGYDRMFILPAKVDIESDFNLDGLAANSTITKIRNTFIKAAGKRNNSRSFLNRFADVIANPNAK